MSRPLPARSSSPALPAVALGLLLGGCLGYPQRLPGPLVLPEGAETSAGAVREPGGSLVTVHRDSDPVWVRRPGARDDYAMAFHTKRERVATGSLVRTGAGGRAELLWSPDASSVLLFDECRVTLGDPLRDEPTVVFHSLTRALVTTTPEDRFELPGGAVLRGDPTAPSGPILVDTIGPQFLRVVNQAKQPLQLRYRDRTLELVPGDSIDLPRVATDEGGTAPVTPEPEGQRFESAGTSVVSTGRLEARGGLLEAVEPARATAGGVAVRLSPGETVAFSGLAKVPPAPPADASGSPHSQ